VLAFINILEYVLRTIEIRSRTVKNTPATCPDFVFLAFVISLPEVSVYQYVWHSSRCHCCRGKRRMPERYTVAESQSRRGAGCNLVETGRSPLFPVCCNHLLVS
jgi:hypothetical protein